MRKELHVRRRSKFTFQSQSKTVFRITLESVFFLPLGPRLNDERRTIVGSRLHRLYGDQSRGLSEQDVNVSPAAVAVLAAEKNIENS